MSDYMVRAIGGGGNVRIFVARTTDLVDEARRRHDTWPTTTAALGRTLTATGLLSATLKEANESITVRVEGDGPCGGIVCDADEQGHVRGYVREPHAEAEPKNGKLNVAGVVGSGYIHVTRQLAIEGVYTGSSEIVSGEIAEDLTHYLYTSEQAPSAVALGVLVAPEGKVVAAGGYLLQLLPATPEADRDQLEANLRAVGPISQAVEQGLTPEEILADIMAGLDYQILERRTVAFACRCSRERALGSLTTINPVDLQHMIDQDKGAEMTCHFCGEVYHFTEEELRSVHTQHEEPPHHTH